MVRLADRDAILESHKPARNRRRFFAWDDNADKVQRIRRRNGDDFPRWRLRAERAQRFDCHRQRKLLADEICHEAAAADFSTIFQASESDQHLAPARKDRFAGQQFSEDDAIPIQEHPADGFHLRSLIRMFFRMNERPAANTVAGPRMATAALTSTAFGIDQRAKIIETICGEEADRDQFPKRGFDLGLEPARAADNVGEERGPSVFQDIQLALSRAKKEMGATLVGVTRRVRSEESISSAGWGERRRQPMAPRRQS